MDDELVDWLVGAYDAGELTEDEMNVAKNDRRAALDLWEEFCFFADEVELVQCCISRALDKIRYIKSIK